MSIEKALRDVIVILGVCCLGSENEGEPGSR